MYNVRFTELVNSRTLELSLLKCVNSVGLFVIGYHKRSWLELYSFTRIVDGSIPTVDCIFFIQSTLCYMITKSGKEIYFHPNNKLLYEPAGRSTRAKTPYMVIIQYLLSRLEVFQLSKCILFLLFSEK